MYVLCETDWISVVCLTTSSGIRRPFDSIRWDAKMVLIRVDFPRPVWPTLGVSLRSQSRFLEQLTNADDVELKAALEELALNLGSDAVETDMALGHHRPLLGRLLRGHALLRHRILGGH